jgi:hypothetical protein
MDTIHSHWSVILVYYFLGTFVTCPPSDTVFGIGSNLFTHCCSRNIDIQQIWKRNHNICARYAYQKEISGYQSVDPVFYNLSTLHLASMKAICTCHRVSHVLCQELYYCSPLASSLTALDPILITLKFQLPWWQCSEKVRAVLWLVLQPTCGCTVQL